MFDLTFLKNGRSRDVTSEYNSLKEGESDFQLRSVYCLFDELAHAQLQLVFGI